MFLLSDLKELSQMHELVWLNNNLLTTSRHLCTKNKKSNIKSLEAEWCQVHFQTRGPSFKSSVLKLLAFFSLIFVCNPTSKVERNKGAKDAYKRYPC